MGEPQSATLDPPDRTDAGTSEGWHLSVARFLGRATRWATTEAQAVASGAAGVSRRGAAAATADAERLRRLLSELARMVTDHIDEGTEALERAPGFWRLIGELHEGHVRARRARDAAHEPSDAEAGSERSQVIDVQVAEPAESREAGQSEGSPLTPDEEAAAKGYSRSGTEEG